MGDLLEMFFKWLFMPVIIIVSLIGAFLSFITGLIPILIVGFIIYLIVISVSNNS